MLKRLARVCELVGIAAFLSAMVFGLAALMGAAPPWWMWWAVAGGLVCAVAFTVGIWADQRRG